MNVGWIGLGAMGHPMAAVVARDGHTVRAYDLDPTRADSLRADGVVPVGTLAEAARGADVLVIMVATPDQVEAVLFGDDAAAAALGEGSVAMIMATVGPAAVEGWAQRLARGGVAVVDAPVSGGVARAAQGDLLIMVGGSPAAVASAQPLLDAMAAAAPVVGDRPGDGQRVKLVNQLLCGVHIAVAGEALAFAEALGLDIAATWETLRHGAANSFMFADRGSRMVAPTGEVNSAIDIFVKDMGLVNAAAAQAGAASPLATVAQQLFVAGHDAGLGRADDSSIIDVLRRLGTDELSS